jgi:hypothetical protein
MKLDSPDQSDYYKLKMLEIFGTPLSAFVGLVEKEAATFAD